MPQYKGAPAERLFAQVEADDGNIAQLLFLHIFYIDRQVRHARRLAVRDKLRKGGAHRSFAVESFASVFGRKECRQITAPLLLVQGVNDDYGTLRQLDEIAHAVPHARQCRLADCGHSPHRDQATLSLQAVIAFLEATA